MTRGGGISLPERSKLIFAFVGIHFAKSWEINSVQRRDCFLYHSVSNSLFEDLNYLPHRSEQRKKTYKEGKIPTTKGKMNKFQKKKAGKIDEK